MRYEPCLDITTFNDQTVFLRCLDQGEMIHEVLEILSYDVELLVDYMYHGSSAKALSVHGQLNFAINSILLSDSK